MKRSETPRPEVLVVGTPPGFFIDSIAEDFSLVHLQDGNPAALMPAVAERTKVLLAFGRVGKELIGALPRLQLVACGGAGYDKIDLDALRQARVSLTNTPGVTEGCVADLAFGLLLAVTRQIVTGDRFVRSGRWGQEPFPRVPRVHGRKIGILGLGRIGAAIARRAEGFEMQIAYHNRAPLPNVAFQYYPTPVALAAAVDFLVVSCPGGASTHHLVDERVLGALGKSGFIVNVSRGSVVDEAALVHALTEGLIAGAGLDVFEQEPNVPEQLRRLDNVVLMPHRGGGTFETYDEVIEKLKKNLKAFFAGMPLPDPVYNGQRPAIGAEELNRDDS